MKTISLIKSFLITILILLLLALDWAAMHDIIKGEEDTTFEYSIVAISFAVFGFLFINWIKKSKKSNQSV